MYLMNTISDYLPSNAETLCSPFSNETYIKIYYYCPFRKTMITGTMLITSNKLIDFAYLYNNLLNKMFNIIYDRLD